MDDDDNDDDNEDEKDGRLMGRVGDIIGKNDDNEIMSDQELHRALPKMSWTLHGENLGAMLDDYRVKSRHIKRKQRCKLGHFLNTTSNTLDMIGSMTENTILRSVEFPNNKDNGLLTGGSLACSTSNKAINNKPPASPYPSKENLMWYMAVFPDYLINKGNTLAIEPMSSVNMFLEGYPQYPMTPWSEAYG